MAMIKCPTCGEMISDRSKRCVKCGHYLVKTDFIKCPECGAEVEEDAKFCGNCGCPIQITEKKKSGKTVLITILALISLFLFYLCYSQANTISYLEDQISDRDSQIAEMDKQISELQEVEKQYNAVRSFFKTDNLLNTSDYFYSSEYFIVVGKNEKDRQFTLTTNIAANTTVSYSSSNPSVANVSFNDDTWTKQVGITVIPKKTGTTVITFTSDSVSSVVKVLIVVE